MQSLVFPLFNLTDLDVASPVMSNLTTRLDSLVLTEVSQYHGMGVRDKMPTHPLITNSLYTIAEQTDLM